MHTSAHLAKFASINLGVRVKSTEIAKIGGLTIRGNPRKKTNISPSAYRSNALSPIAYYSVNAVRMGLNLAIYVYITAL